MADWNKKPEFQDEKTEEKEISREEMNEMIRTTVNYTEIRCKRQFRKWLSELVIIVSGISVWIYLICMTVERAKVLPTEPYRDINRLDLIFAVVTILSVVIADCVRQRNM